MVSYCIHQLSWWNVGQSLCRILGQQIGQVCTLIIHITADMGGIIICPRQLQQSYGQLLYPSTVLVECWAESLQDTGPTNGAGMYIYYTYHNR